MDTAERKRAHRAPGRSRRPVRARSAAACVRIVGLLAGVALAASTLASCSPEGEAVAVLTTDIGDIAVALHRREAPAHSARFLRLVSTGAYDGSAILVAQRGQLLELAPAGIQEGRTAGVDPQMLESEISRDHVAGAVGAARLPDEVNPGRQSLAGALYICVTPQPALNGGYTVFGQVIEGRSVVEAASRASSDGGNPIRVTSSSIERRILRPGEP